MLHDLYYSQNNIKKMKRAAHMALVRKKEKFTQDFGYKTGRKEAAWKTYAQRA
jgi:hypothetical protein